MGWMLFRFVWIAVGTLAVLAVLIQVRRNAQRLDKKIKEFKAEQENLQNTPGPINPYAAMAELYNHDENSRAPEKSNPLPNSSAPSQSRYTSSRR